MVTIALLLAAATPSAEALTLGRQIAEHGTLGTLLPMMRQKETEEMVAAHPELNATEQAKLRTTSKRVFEAGRDRIMQSEGRAWAEQLSLPQLRAVATFQGSAAGKHYRAAMPVVIGSTMKSIGQMDFKGDVSTAFCKETGKLCAK